MIFDIENSLWKSIIGTFWQTVTRWKIESGNFIWLQLILCQKPCLCRVPDHEIPQPKLIYYVDWGCMSEIWISKLNLRFGLNWEVFDSELEIQLVNSWVLNISFEPEFGNPIIEIQVSKFGFLSNCWFYSLVPAVKPGVLNLFLNSKIWFSNSDFQNSFSIPNWYWKPRKIHFKSKKGRSLIYFNKNSRAVGRSENLGVPVVIRWA